MFIDKVVSVKINPANFKHFKKYHPKVGDILKIDINELNIGSSVKINVKCDVCGIVKNLKYKYYTSYGYVDGGYLCKKCKLKLNLNKKYNVDNVFQLDEIKEKTKNTIIEKYGVDNISKSNEIKNKKIKTCVEKYGTTHHSKNNKIKEKIKNTNLEKYGVDNVSKLDDIKNKKTKTCNLNHGCDYIFKTDNFIHNLKNHNLETYGVEHIFQNEIIKEKIKNTNLEKYGVGVASKSKHIKTKIINSNYETKNKKTLKNNKNIINIDNINKTLKIHCDICGENYNINTILYYKRREYKTILCTICNPLNNHTSGLEKQLLFFIKNNYNSTIIENDRKILNGKELDIYLPDLNLAFEFNGLYWHSEIYKDKYYHYNKYMECKEQNIQLIQVWEDDWLYNQDIIKSMILNKFGITKNKIYARKTKIKEITDNNLIRIFLNNNHIQRFVGSSIKLGLFYNDDLVSLMCFKKTKDGYELNRFCNKINYNIVGGASKLLKYFNRNYDYEELISFSNNDYSNGGLYTKLNFKIDKLLKVDYSYIIDNKKTHKYNIRKYKQINESYHELNKRLFGDKIYKIYDSGKIKFKEMKK